VVQWLAAAAAPVRRGRGVSSGFSKVWQGPPHGGTAGPQGGGVVRTMDQWKVPPL
jgi:hypothetical protein